MKTTLRSLLCITALMTAACVIEPDHWGTLQVDWTIRGHVDPDLCLQAGAATLAVDVYDSHGLVGTYDAPCRAFATSIALYPDTYSADATLLDAAGRPRSTTVAIAPFRVWRDSTTAIPIDFPLSSFY